MPRGKVVAELTFGFWRYLSSAAHEKSLWVPHLHRAFARRTRRHDDVDRPVADLNRLRNRAAHHEHLLTVDLRQAHRTGVALADRIDPDLGAHLRRTAALPSIVADARTPPGVRPTPRGARWAGIDASGLLVDVTGPDTPPSPSRARQSRVTAGVTATVFRGWQAVRGQSR